MDSLLAMGVAFVKGRHVLLTPTAFGRLATRLQAQVLDLS
jgi:hypothetical protein